MKLKRMVASVLVLLLAVSLLPMTALAESTFYQYGGKIEEGQEFTYNATKDVTNYGTVTNNNCGPETSPLPVSIKDNYGTVVNNGDSYEGTVENNHAGATVENNKPKGTVENNFGLVTNNTGAVNNNESGGTVVNNNGKVSNNKEGGTVEKNLEGGTIEVNAGTVGVVDEDGEIVYGYGNFGTVKTNAAGGVVTDNSGSIGTNEKDAEVVENYGTIGANSGIVDYNADEQCTYNGTDWDWLGTPAVVNNLAGGEVVENYGLVNNKAGGLLNDMILSENEDIPKYEQFEGEEGTYVGTWVDRGSIQNEDGTTEEFQDGGVYTVLKQAILDAAMDLKKVGELFKKDGYEVIGYTTKMDETEGDPDVPVEAFYALDDGTDEVKPVVVYSTEYTVKEPQGWLSLIWGKIKAAVKPSGSSDEPETKTVQNNIPTSLSADQVKVGAYVRRGNMIFKIIEVTDNDIRVATVGKLSEQDLADMLACLKKYLSDAQIAKLIGEPELLEEELVTRFFADSREHIAFRAAKDLFA